MKQGECQGNGAAPAGFQQECTLMLNAQRQAGHVINITSPISKQSTSQAGIVFVDDTNLWAGLDEDDDAESATYKAQQGVTNWGKLLIAGGGALQPPKCKWTVHDQVVKEDGIWEYRTINLTLPADNKNKDVDTMRDDTLSNLKTKVPQASGDVVAIKQLMQSEAAKNLGLFTRPDGVNEPHLAQIKERIEE